MTNLTVGDKLPEAKVYTLGENGPAAISIREKLAGRKVVLFAVPGAFTGTCTTAHVPSFIRTAEAFRAKGVDEIFCVAVNDVFVLKAWAKETGADAAGIGFISDASGEFSKAIGLSFDAPAIGLFGRSKRYALLAEDGVVKVLQVEESPGVCEVSGGEALLAAI